MKCLAKQFTFRGMRPFSGNYIWVHQGEFGWKGYIFINIYILKWYFRDNSNEGNSFGSSNRSNANSQYGPSFYVKSGWNPPRADPILQSYLSLLESEVISVTPEGRNFSNLSIGERQALYDLKSDKTIVIKEADKGSAVVVWDREDYCAEAYRQLNDSSVYEELDSSPISQLGAEVSNVVSEIQVCEQALSDKEAEYLQVRGSKLGRFYLLPKMHKGFSDVVGRPVISDCGTATEHISEYLDFHLNPLVSKIKSFVKDTSHFLSLLAQLGEIPDNALLCTADVVGLYPNIPHNEELEAMHKALDTRQNPSVSTESIVSLGKLVLNNNFFEFDGRVYKQKLGIAIGTKFAPAYSSFFMSNLEEELLSRCEVRSWVWYRYIDDVFFIWTHDEEKLSSFVEYMNSYHRTIKFTTEISKDSVSYLDVLVSRNGGVLETDLYCKSTDTHQYLQKGSCHPWHVKKTIPYGQALRIRRICSDEKKFRMRSEELVGC